MPDDSAIETQATELLRTLIRNGCVNTGEATSGHEERSVAALEDFFAGAGLSCERYTSQPGRMSLITRIEGRDPKAPVLLLMGHTDVVPVTPSGWQRDPFAAELVDGIVWGRGAIDMLNLTSTMAVATRRLATSGWRPRGTLIFLAVADEEAGGFLGAGHLVEPHACTHTTFSPNIAHGGTKVNVIPDRVDIDVDIRSLPGVEQHEVEAMIKEALGPFVSRVTIETPSDRRRGGSVSPTDTPLIAAIRRVSKRMMPDSTVVPAITTGGTDAKFFRWKGIPAYGFGLHSLRIPYTEYAVMFHGHNERVDTESLKLSAMMWEALCRDFLG